MAHSTTITLDEFCAQVQRDHEAFTQKICDLGLTAHETEFFLLGAQLALRQPNTHFRPFDWDALAEQLKKVLQAREVLAQTLARQSA